MSLRNLIFKAGPIARGISTSVQRRSDHSTRGVVGSTVPFSLNNRYALLGMFILFFGSGLALPFISLRAMILKKNSA